MGVTAGAGSASETPTAGAVDTVANAATPVEQAEVAIVAPDAAPVTVADATTSTPIAPAASAIASDASASPSARRHVVARGDSASKIAARYDISVSDLLQRNSLTASSVLRPGKVLLIDPAVTMGDLPTAAGPP